MYSCKNYVTIEEFPKYFVFMPYKEVASAISYAFMVFRGIIGNSKKLHNDDPFY